MSEDMELARATEVLLDVVRDAARYRFLRSEGPDVAQLIRDLAKHPEATLSIMDKWVDAARAAHQEGV